jgi:ribosomal protein L10
MIEWRQLCSNIKIIALAEYQGLSKKELNEIQKIIEGKSSEIAKAWKKHFPKS